MFLDRSFVALSTNLEGTRYIGAASSTCVALMLLFFAGPAFSNTCDLKAISRDIPAGDVTKTVQANFEKLADCIKDLQSRLEKIQNATGSATINGTDGSVAGSLGSVNGLAGTYSLDNDKFVACPPGSFVSAIQGFKPNGQTPIVQIRYACRSIK